MLNYSITNYRDMEEMLKEMGYSLESSFTKKPVQLDSKQAWVHDVTIKELKNSLYKNVKMLQSYGTLVDVIIDGIAYRTRKHSSTTSKQCTIFERYYC